MRTIITQRNTEAFLFGNSIKLIRATEKLLQKVIVNIESNNEFFIVAHIRIVRSSEPGTLFSLIRLQTKRLYLLDLSVKGTRDKLKLLLRYRSINDTAETVVFKNVAGLGDGKYHKVIIRITDTIKDNKKISAVALYVDCEYFGRVDTVSPVSSIFSYKGTLLSLMELTIAQRGFGKNVQTKWKVSDEHLKLPLHS